MQDPFDPLLDPHFPKGQRTGGDQPAGNTAGEQRHGIDLLGFHIHIANDLFITGKLNIPAEQNIGDPAEGIEPVDRQNRPTQRLPPMVAAGKMRLFVGNHTLHLSLVHVRGKINARAKKAENKRRLDVIAEI